MGKKGKKHDKMGKKGATTQVADKKNFPFPTFSLQSKDQRSMFWKNLSGSQFETLKTSLLKN